VHCANDTPGSRHRQIFVWSVAEQIMIKTKRSLTGPEIIFDENGDALRVSRRGLARRLGRQAAGRDPIDYAIQEIGFVRVQQAGRALVVEFQPTTARMSAVVAAFYEIAERAPETIVLVCRSEADLFEIFRNIGPALRRIEALIKRDS
jgi:hypothetical protein